MKTQYDSHGAETLKTADIYERVTAQILEKLEAGVCPWKAAHTGAAFVPPRNFHTGKHYNGANVFLLAMRGYESPWFMTYKQAQERGGQVRKGERGSLVIKYAVYEKDAPAEGGTADAEAEPERRGFVKGYTVFNACQIDGIDFPSPPGGERHPERPPVEAAEAIVRNMPDAPVILEGPERVPHYLPALDIVKMPERRRFVTMEKFYHSLYHELIHAVGHEKRLARKTLIENKGMFAAGAEDKRTYCLEELVAEMGAAFLCARARIDGDGHENSAAYLKGWLEVLKVKEHRRWIIQAAAQAQKAAAFILGVKAEPERTEAQA